MTPSSENQSSAPLDVTELKRLIAALSDGQLQPAEHARLEQLLRTNREARSIYMAYMQIDSGLDWKIRGRQSVCGLADLSSKTRATAEAGFSKPNGKGSKLPQSRIFYAGAALAASLVIVVASVLWISRQAGWNSVAVADANHESDGRAVAKIVELSDECRWFVENRRNGDGVVVVGDKVRLTRGQLRMEFACGATVTMKSPAALDVVSPTRTRAILGTLKAHVEKGAEGFTVETPRTTVVDLGTDFGIDVSDHGSTDVIVFTGAVDVHSDGVEGLGSRQRFNAGEGVRVSGEGTASRIVSIDDSQFSITAVGESRHRTPVISAVSDNISRGESWFYYEVVHGGMREDAKSFVDRPHEWNGVKDKGMPSYLLGADYVKTFNDDKLNQKVEIRVTLDRPAILYVLLDKRSPPPDWLRENFYNTYDEIGLDGGGYKRFGVGLQKTVEVGPGASIDDTFSIWRLDVRKACTVKLGAMGAGSQYHNMYGIAAVPLEIHESSDDFANSRDPRSNDVTILPADDTGKLAINGQIERADDIDVFKFDWQSGVAEVACSTSGLTTLDPTLRIYDANDKLVGFAQTQPAHRERTAVTMNLPAGPYFVEVAGGNDIGEVGAYQVQVAKSAAEKPAPLPNSPELVLRAATTETGAKLSWDLPPTVTSYAIEKSTDSVTFEPLTITAETAAVDSSLKSGETRVYRLRADTPTGQFASRPIIVRGKSAAVERLCALGLSSQATVLEWSASANGEGYRIERSADGQNFEALGSAPQHANGYRDLSVQPGHRYFYRVVTLNSIGGDAISKPVQALSGVANVTALAVASNRVELSWTPDYPHARYYVQRAVHSSDEFVTVGAVNGDTQSFIDQLAIPGSNLKYRVVAVEDVSTLPYAKEDAIDIIRLPDGAEDDDYFGLRITGKIRIDDAGLYTFFLHSDDGSKLFLDGALVIDNDGRHAPLTMASAVQLAAGYHDLEVQYFQIDGRRALELSWNGPGTRHPRIAHHNLPDPYLSDLTYRYYEGNWQRMPFERIVAVSSIVGVSTPMKSDAGGN